MFTNRCSLGLTNNQGLRWLCFPLVLTALAGVAEAQARPGSIYDASRGPIGPIADKTARRAGDLVTVIILEKQNVTNEDKADIAKSTNLNYELTSFNLKPGFFNTLPDIAANSSDQFSGQAQVNKRDSFEARLTAMVVDVLPNGNMILSGRREIRIENQTKLIEFSGIVRRFDVTPANTVASELVADARISYVGDGPLSQATKRRGLGAKIHQAMSWLWPF
jgi:flagellar L-ring protein precursor FlgH